MASLDREHWSVLSPLLDRAFELEPGALARWLQALRAEQPSVADELEGLLADRDAMCRDGFLDSENAGESLRTIGTVHLAEQSGLDWD